MTEKGAGEREREDNADELAREMVHYVPYNQQAFANGKKS